MDFSHASFSRILPISLRRPWLVVAMAGVAVGLSVLYLVPSLAPGRDAFGENGHLLLRLMVLIALLPAAGSLWTPSERRFWSLLFAAMALWFIANLVLQAPDEVTVKWGLVEDIRSIAFWPILLLAIAQRPESSVTGLRFRGTGLVVGAAAFLMVGWVYSNLALPYAIYAPQRFLEGIPSWYTFAIGSSLFAFLFAWRAIQSHRRWRSIYGLLGLAMGLWAGADVVEGLRIAGLVTLPEHTSWGLLTFLPYFLVAAATVARDQLPGAALPGMQVPGSMHWHTVTLIQYGLAIPVTAGFLTLSGWGDEFPAWHLWFGTLGVVAMSLATWIVHQRTRSTAPDGVHVVIMDQALQQSQKMEALGRLSGGIAHDFNNLLLIVQGHVELMAPQLETIPKGREFVDRIRTAVTQGSDLTRQLLAFGRSHESGQQRVCPNDVIRSTESLLRQSAGRRAEVRFDLADDLWVANVDAGQLTQILINLAMNAGHALDDTGRLTIRTRNVRVEGAASDREEFVEVEVSDTGRGMDEATRERAFEPFFTTRTEAGGTGLGLSVVYGIVRQCGGHVSCHSAPGLGTTFRIHLPRVEAMGSVLEHDEPRAPRARAGEVLLLVEDQADVRAIAARYLKDVGYEVVEASDGQVALELLKGHQGRLDLLVTDVIMPNLDGKALARRFRDLRPHTPILFITGFAKDLSVELEQLPASMLAKPFQLEQLAAKVREVLDQSGGTGAGARRA